MPAKKDPLNYNQALTYGLRLLQQRSYSEFMLRQKLHHKGTVIADCDKVIDRLKELGLIDDVRYTQSLIRTEASYRHASSRMISQKLRQKGVNREIIDTNLNEMGTVPSEAERALYHGRRFMELLAQKKMPVATHERRQHLLGYLYRKGFSRSAIEEAAKQLMSNSP